MKTVYIRMKSEERALSSKCNKLSKVIGTKRFFKYDLYEQSKIIEQLAYMNNYLNVLRERIDYYERKRFAEKE